MYLWLIILLSVTIIAIIIYYISNCNQSNYEISPVQLSKIKRITNNYKICMLIPYWKNKKENLQMLYAYYKKMKNISKIWIIEHKGGNKSGIKNSVVNPNDLRLRFMLPSNKYNGIIICDDDMIVEEKTIQSLIYHCMKEQQDLIGLYGRNYTDKYNAIDEYGEVDAVLTKFFLVNYKPYKCISRIAVNTAEIFGVFPTNGEDLYFNYLWKIFMGRRYALYKNSYISNIDMNDYMIQDSRTDTAISSEPKHQEQRSDLIHKFTYKNIFDILPYNNYNIAICMWYDDGIKEYADYAYKINNKFALNNNFSLFYSKKRNIKERKPHWERFPLMLEIMKDNKYDYIMWIDADACFINENNQNNELLKLITVYDEYNVILSSDKYEQHPTANINSGVIIIKNNDYGKEVINYWLSQECYEERITKGYKYQDQGCIRLSWAENKINLRDNCVIVPFGTLQTFAYFYQDNDDHQYSLIRHFTNNEYLGNNEYRKYSLGNMWNKIQNEI